MTRRIQLADIARRLGLSPATVSLALRDGPEVASATRRRVLAMAGRLNYVPDNIGRALRMGRSSLIGFIVPSVVASFYNELIHGVAGATEAAGYGLLLSVTGDDSAGEARQLRLFMEKNIDGMILAFHRPRSVPIIRDMRRRGVPGVICDFNSDILPCIRIDERRAVRLVLDHLLGLGHERVAYVASGAPSSVERYEILAEYMTSDGLREPVFCDGVAGAKAALARRDRPTAVFAYSDLLAIEIRYMAGELGLKVPADVSLVGFDDMPFAEWREVGLTTVAQPRQQMGRIAAEMVIKGIAGGRITSRLLEPKLVVRSSTAARTAGS